MECLEGSTLPDELCAPVREPNNNGLGYYIVVPNDRKEGHWVHAQLYLELYLPVRGLHIIAGQRMLTRGSAKDRITATSIPALCGIRSRSTTKRTSQNERGPEGPLV